MKHLPSSQLEIMMVVWESERPLTRKQIHHLLAEKEWETVTLNTFLSRLVQNGFLKIDHQGREYLYSPLIEKDAYLSYEGKNILKTLYQNSIKKFIASVCDCEKMTENEVEELQLFLRKLKEDSDE